MAQLRGPASRHVTAVLERPNLPHRFEVAGRQQARAATPRDASTTDRGSLRHAGKLHMLESQATG